MSTHFCNHQYDLQLEHSFIARASLPNPDYPCWRSKLPEDDPRLAFAKEYDDMQGLFRRQHKLIPVTFAHALCLMFSNNEWEVAFMVHMWELLKLYSVEGLDDPKTDLMEVPGMPDRYVFDPSSDYPLRYTNRGGPVPIQMVSDMVRPTGLVAAKSLCNEEQYKWTVDQYRYSLLAMLVMAVQPQFHDGFSFESKPKEMIHAHPDSTREMVTCAQVLPSVFATRNDVGIKFPRFDEHQADCGDCDIPTVVVRFIAFNTICWAEHKSEEYYITTEDVRNQVDSLNKDRVPYEDFWRVLANDHNSTKAEWQWARSWDTGNWWAMLKLNAFDKQEGREGYYTTAKATKISQMADGFLQERAEILSRPRKTHDRPGEFRPFDTSYLNIGGTDKMKITSKSKQAGQATSTHPTHLADDYPKIGAHVATPLSHLGPGMRDEDLFVPPPHNYHVERREERRRDCHCYGEVEDLDEISENDISWLSPSYRTTSGTQGSSTSASNKRSADDDIESEDKAGPSKGSEKGEIKKAKQV